MVGFGCLVAAGCLCPGFLVWLGFRLGFVGCWVWFWSLVFDSGYVVVAFVLPVLIILCFIGEIWLFGYGGFLLLWVWLGCFVCVEVTFLCTSGYGWFVWSLGFSGALWVWCFGVCFLI